MVSFITVASKIIYRNNIRVALVKIVL